MPQVLSIFFSFTSLPDPDLEIGGGWGRGGRAVIQTLSTYGPLFDFDVLPVQRQTLQTVTGYSYRVQQWALRFLLLQQKFMCKISRNKDKQALAGTIPPWLRYVDDTAGHDMYFVFYKLLATTHFS